MTSRNEEMIYNEYKALIDQVKAFAKEKLVGYDWLEKLRLRAKQYIENNGHNTTVDEVTDYLIEEAFKTFPENIFEEMIAKLEPEITEIMMTSFT